MDALRNRLVDILSRTWWLLLLRGLAAIAFGTLTWFRPGISLAALVLLFGVYALADGVLGVGVLALLAPGITALALLFYIAIWAIAAGVLEIVAAIRLRKEIEGEWLLLLGGLVSVAFGLILMARPAAGALAVLWLIAGFAVVFGALLVILAFRVRTFGKRVAGAA